MFTQERFEAAKHKVSRIETMKCYFILLGVSFSVCPLEGGTLDLGSENGTAMADVKRGIDKRPVHKIQLRVSCTSHLH